MSGDHPYAQRYGVTRAIPGHGRSRDEILAQLTTMAAEEDALWETGRCSGTIYCGDHDHYAFMSRAFGLFAHMNALQRDMCPSASRFEGEILAMVSDLLHGDAVADGGPCGVVTSGGTESILTAMLAYREHGRRLGIRRPSIVKPETAHPAFNKACELFGIELRVVPVDPGTTLADIDAMAERIDDSTVALIGSACNYGYGTVDPIPRLSELALECGVGLHVDGCLGGFILPWGERLGYDIPPFDFRLPGVTTISADTHKYGYGFKGTSTLLFRDPALRRGVYFFEPGWSGGKYMSPGIAGSRSVGLLAATWAAMVAYGRDGYLERARRIFETSDAMQAAVRRHPPLRIMGRPTFCFSITSDEFDIYLVNDVLRERGWRLNGQQYPNAIHMAVTGPQTQPGVVEAWERDLADAVDWARTHPDVTPSTGSVYGGIPGGLTPDAEAFIVEVMADLLDRQQSLPPPDADPGSAA